MLTMRRAWPNPRETCPATISHLSFYAALVPGAGRLERKPPLRQPSLGFLFIFTELD